MVHRPLLMRGADAQKIDAEGLILTTLATKWHFGKNGNAYRSILPKECRDHKVYLGPFFRVYATSGS
jgi:hypothetical protein